MEMLYELGFFIKVNVKYYIYVVYFYNVKKYFLNFLNFF